jgi:FkbM family methyltransferase
MNIDSTKLRDFTINGLDKDYIFSIIKNTNEFYEIAELEQWSNYFDNVEVILDIGANIGNHTIYWSQNENIKKIIAFEPIERNFRLLKKNISDNKLDNVEINQLGLGKKEGFAIINKEDLNNMGATSLKFVEDETDIKIVPGDSFLSNKNHPIDLMKIDVEGFEINVLRGLKQTIQRYKPIIWVEVTLDNVMDILAILDKHNYCLIDIMKFNILAIHETKIRNLKEISRNDLIFNMLKNLEASWNNRRDFLNSLEQKNKEIMRAEELEEISEKHLSQFLGEKQKFEDLLAKNKGLTSDLFNEQRISEDLIEKNTNLESILTQEKEKTQNLTNKNTTLKNTLNLEKEKKLDLMKRNKDLESNLFNQQITTENLTKRNKDLETNLINEQRTTENLTKRNKDLKSNLFNEQRISEDLIERNEDLKFSLNEERDRVEELNELSEKRLSQFSHMQKKAERLQKQKEHLEGLVEAYRSRKVVRLMDTILDAKNIPSNLKTVFSNKKDPLKPESGYADYRKDSTDVEKTTINNELISEVHQSKTKKLKDIKIAVILDEFSYNSFKYEFNAITFEPSNWLEIFETEKPDLFLCESAWSGIDSEKRPWRGMINFDFNTKTENRGTLLEILKYCHEKSITTIFWNKEDPTNFMKFVDTAIKFDHIFTSAEECIPRYEEEYGHKSVHSLMFATQPKIFNPIEKQERSEDIVFAGSWYSHFPERCMEMTEIFDNILDSGLKLKIYDRAYYTLDDDPKRFFPDKYGEYINPPVPHDQVEKIYKESKYSLNINTVTKSKTMFARRAFELMSCNTLVLSNYSEGINDLFGDNVIFVGKEKIDLSDSGKKKINNLYNVLRNHTYSNRIQKILDDINYEYLPDDNFVTLYYVANNQSEIEDILEHYKSVRYDYKKLVILLSDEIPSHLIKNIYGKYANNEVAVYSLNYLLNQNGVISNDTPYFLFADLKIKKDFVEKAILHYSYIELEVGIAMGDRFTFEKAKDVKNVLLSHKNFNKAFKNSFKDGSSEFSVYTIQT